MSAANGDMTVGVVFQFRNQISGGARQAGDSIRDLDDVTQRARRSTQRLSEEERNAARQARQAAREFDAARANVKSYAQDTVGGMQRASLGIIAGGVAAGKMASDFEYGMDKISTVADTSQISIDQLGQNIIKLSTDTGNAASDLQQGMYDAISSGVETTKVTQFMGTAVKAAKGGFTDTATAVDGLTTVLNAYGKKADEAGSIANQMMIAQNLGKTTFGEMASAMGNVVPTSAALGVSTKELFSSMAVLTANGIKTSESVTGLKAAFSNIIKPSSDAAKAADALGIKFSASEVKSKGWMPFLSNVKSKLQATVPAYAKAVDQVNNLTMASQKEAKAHGTGTEAYKKLQTQLTGAKTNLEQVKKASGGQIDKFAQMFGSVEALNTVLTLTSDQGMSLYSQSMKQMAGGTKVLDDAYAKMQANNTTKVNKALNSIKNTAITVGAAFLPVIASISTGISKLATGFGALPKSLQGIIIGSAMSFVALTGLITVGMKVHKTIKAVSDGIKIMKEAQVAQTIATKAASAATKIWSGVQAVFNAIMAINPVVLIVIGVIALIAAIVLLVKHWDGICKKIPWLGKAFQAVKGVVTTVLHAIGSVFKAVFNALKPVISVFVAIFKVQFGIIRAVFGVFVGIFKIGFAILFTVASTIFIAIKTVVTVVFNVIKKIVSVVFNALKAKFIVFANFVSPVIYGIAKVFTIVFNKAKSIVMKVIDALKKAFKGVGSFIGDIFHGIGKVIKGVVNAIISALNFIIHGINKLSFKAPSWVPVIGGKQFGFNIPDIPKLAKGTKNFQGGAALVGEQGPEIVRMPRGAQVVPHKRSEDILSGGTFRTPSKVEITIAKIADSVIIREDADLDKLAVKFARQLQMAQVNFGGAKL